jgi:Icc-related predicted phosphoesterase
MKFLYTTDLHGNTNKYNTVLETATEHGISLIHLGADLLPKGSSIQKIQKRFINGFLKDFYARCHDAGITVLAFFGNDDLYYLKDRFRRYASLLDETPFTYGGYEFKAYGYVPDYRFTLKHACKRDYIGWTLSEEYLGPPIEIDKTGRHEIKDVARYFYEKGTIEEDLKSIKINKKTIIAIHSPPANTDLDLCGVWNGLGWAPGRHVGSVAVYNWIVREQPSLVLCGHIHEAPECNGNQWKTRVGNSLIIQPGQKMMKTTCVLIEIEDNEIFPLIMN